MFFEDNLISADQRVEESSDQCFAETVDNQKLFESRQWSGIIPNTSW